MTKHLPQAAVRHDQLFLRGVEEMRCPGRERVRSVSVCRCPHIMPFSQKLKINELYWKYIEHAQKYI